MKDKKEAGKQHINRLKGKDHPINEGEHVDGNIVADGGTDNNNVERKKVEEKYKQLLEDIKDSYLVIQDARIVFANRRFGEIVGYELEKVLGKPLAEFVSPGNRKAIMELYERTVRGDEIPVELIEAEMIKADGTIVIVEASIKPIEYEGKPAFSVIVRDITERRQVEEALKESQELYRSLVETVAKAGEGIIMAQDIGDIEGIIVFANDEALRITGYSREELIGQTIQYLFPPNNPPDLMEWYRRKQAGEEFERQPELSIRRKDGIIVPIEYFASLTTYQGKTASIAHFRDITERRNAEEALRESQGIYKSMVETAGKAGEGIGIVQNVENTEGVLVFANDEVLRITGYKRDELIGRTFLDLLHRETLSEFINLYRRRQAGEELPGYSELWLIRKDGTSVPVECCAGTTTYQGKVSTIAFIRDITDRRKAEEKYRQLLEDMNDGYAVLQDGKFIFANRRCTEIFGYEPWQVLGKSLAEFLLPDNRQAIMELYERTIRSNEILIERYETEVAKADGTIVIAEASIKIIQYEGKPAHSVILRDVTERKRMEEKYKQLLEDINDGYAVLQNGVYVFTNRRFCEILGYAPGQMLGMSFTKIVLPHERQGMLELYEKILHGEQELIETIEAKAIKADGTIVITEASVNIIQYEDKPAFSIIVRDITERKRIEEKHKQLLEDMKDGYAVIQDGNVVFANGRLAEIFGYDSEQVTGQSITEFIGPDDYQEAMELYIRVLNGEEEPPERLELMGKKKNGTVFPVQAGVRAIEYENKPAFSIIVRDITERRHMDEMLQRSQEKLHSIIQALPDMLFHISRDGTLLDDPMGQGSKYEQYRSVFPIRTLEDVFPGDFAERALTAIETTLNNGIPQVIEHKMTIPLGAGDEDIYETRIVPSGRDEVLAVSRNITDQKLAEKRLRIYQQQLQSLTSQLSQTEELERRRLAIDLHDLIGQSLAVIKMKLNAWENTLYSSGYAGDMREVVELINSTINNTRSLTFDLSPPVLYELGLEAGLEFLLEKFYECHGIKYEFEDDYKEKSLKNEVRILLYRCTSELLMNVVKHSNAQLVKLSICRDNSQVLITLEDDGVGFAVPEIEAEGEEQGFGLLSIRERLNWIGGSFTLQSEPGNGTKATLKAPLKYLSNGTEGG